MTHLFFEKPIVNSPYDYPSQHWELDETGQPTQKIIATRRQAKFVTPIPKPKKRKAEHTQAELDIGDEVSTEDQQYHSAIINGVRAEVDKWRTIPKPSDWGVTPETARLLQHWRHHDFSGVRPFFCQIEAIETAIWLTEVATNKGKAAQHFLQHLPHGAPAYQSILNFQYSPSLVLAMHCCHSASHAPTPTANCRGG